RHERARRHGAVERRRRLLLRPAPRRRPAGAAPHTLPGRPDPADRGRGAGAEHARSPSRLLEAHELVPREPRRPSAPDRVHAPRRRQPPPARHPRAPAARAPAALPARRERVPVALRHPVALAHPRQPAIPLPVRRGEPRRQLHARRVQDRDLRRQLELAGSDLVPDQPPPHRGAGALPPLLWRRVPAGAADGVGATGDADGGRAGDPTAPGEHLPARRLGQAAVSRRRAALRRGSPLPGPRPVLRILPWRDRARLWSEPPDRLDVACPEVHRRHRPSEERTMNPRGPNAEQITYWNETAGPKWVALQDVLDQQIRPLGRAAMQPVGIATGERVLDVGCGTGDTTVDLARRVGLRGAVTAIDLSAPMLASARQRAAGIGNVTF